MRIQSNANATQLAATRDTFPKQAARSATADRLAKLVTNSKTKPSGTAALELTTQATECCGGDGAAKSSGGSSPTDSANSPRALTLEGLLKAWGQKDSQYDFNGDGTVNTDDLLQFIAGLPAPSQTRPQTAQASESSVDAPAPTATTTDGVVASKVPRTTDRAGTPPPAPPSPTPPPPKLTLGGLLRDWGQTKSPYDLTGDGVVNTDDLLQFLNGLPNGNQSSLHQPVLAAGNPGTSAASEFVASAGQTAGEVADATDPSRPNASSVLRSLTQSLLERLDSAGFKEQPPVNIRELVGQLSLSPNQQSDVFSKLNAKYPDGLGVNVIG